MRVEITAESQPTESLGEIRLVAGHGWDIAGALKVGCAATFVELPGKALFPAAPRPDIVGADLRDVADRIIVA